MKKLIKIAWWYPVSLLFVVSSFILYFKLDQTKHSTSLIRQEARYLSNQTKPAYAFAAIPKIAYEIKTAIATQDARPIVINKYMDKWGSPMEDMGNYITSIADEYKVDPYLIVAIAQQESNLGKKIPDNCHNAWGWGIHSEGTLCFDSWEEGIDTFTRGIAQSYYAYGLYTPDEIMTKYVPHSPEGAWANGVSTFLSQLENGTF